MDAGRVCAGPHTQKAGRAGSFVVETARGDGECCLQRALAASHALLHWLSSAQKPQKSSCGRPGGYLCSRLQGAQWDGRPNWPNSAECAVGLAAS